MVSYLNFTASDVHGLGSFVPLSQGIPGELSLLPGDHLHQDASTIKRKEI